MQYEYTLMRDSDVRFGFWFINLLFSQSLMYTCLHNSSECLRIYVSMIQQRCVGYMFFIQVVWINSCSCVSVCKQKQRHHLFYISVFVSFSQLVRLSVTRPLWKSHRPFIYAERWLRWLPNMNCKALKKIDDMINHIYIDTFAVPISIYIYTYMYIYIYVHVQYHIHRQQTCHAKHTCP